MDQVATAVGLRILDQLQDSRVPCSAGLRSLASLHQQGNVSAHPPRRDVRPSFSTLEIPVAEVAGEKRPALFAALTGLPQI